MDAVGGTFVNDVHISCLFPEILAMIFKHLDVREKGRASQVCSKWRDSAYNRMVWRNVEAKLHLRRANPSLFPSLVQRGIRRIQILSLRRSLRDVITGITNIKSLNLSGCYSVTDVGLGHAFVHEIPKLTALNLSLCKQISDNSLKRIAQNLRNLEELDLSGCTNVTNTGLLLIAWGLQKLKRLNLRSCRLISDKGIAHLSGVGQHDAQGCLELELLGLQDCQRLTDQSLKNISMGLTKIKSINFSFCGSVTDTGLKYLAKMKTLDELNLRSCDNVSDIGIGYLSEGGSRIIMLDVSFCERIGDQTLIHISHGLFSLTSLCLNACNVSDEGIEKLVVTHRDIKTLNLGQCNSVTDRGLVLIADNLKSLQCVDLYGCPKITKEGLQRLMQIPALETLNLGLSNLLNTATHMGLRYDTR